MRIRRLTLVAVVAVVAGLGVWGCSPKENANVAQTVPGPGGTGGAGPDAGAPDDVAASIGKGQAWLLSQYGGSFAERRKTLWGADDSTTGAPQWIGFDALIAAALMTGPAPRTPENCEPLAKTLKLVLAQQDAQGAFSSGNAVYETSVVIWLLARAAELSPTYKQDASVATAIDRAQKYLKLAQIDETPEFPGDYVAGPDDAWSGGWGYGKELRAGKAPANLSTTAFAADALSRAGVAPNDASLQKLIAFLERVQNRAEGGATPRAYAATPGGDAEVYPGTDGGAIYSPGLSKAGYTTDAQGHKVGRSYGSMTYALLKCYLLAGLGKDDPRVKAAWLWLLKAENFDFTRSPGFEATEADPNAVYMGYYYYLFTAGRTLTLMGVDTVTDDKGEPHDWRAELSSALIARQQDNGSWANVRNKRWFENDPRLATSYALLALGECAKR